jgi:hypothetical protein
MKPMSELKKECMNYERILLKTNYGYLCFGLYEDGMILVDADYTRITEWNSWMSLSELNKLIVQYYSMSELKKECMNYERILLKTNYGYLCFGLYVDGMILVDADYTRITEWNSWISLSELNKLID